MQASCGSANSHPKSFEVYVSKSVTETKAVSQVDKLMTRAKAVSHVNTERDSLIAQRNVIEDVICEETSSEGNVMGRKCDLKGNVFGRKPIGR